MRYALDVAPLADLADPTTLLRLGEAAEAGGWDGFSTWDSLGLAMGTGRRGPVRRPRGVAMATERITLVASVIALPRRRPQLVAQSAATLDRLSGGRFVLGSAPAATGRLQVVRRAVGLGRAGGADGRGGRPRRRLAARRDRDLRERLLPVPRRARPAPGPLPRPPIWLGALRPGGIRRAARWDGWIAVSRQRGRRRSGWRRRSWPSGSRSPGRARRCGPGEAPFEIAVFGQAGLGGFGPADYEAVGATWWFESVSSCAGLADDPRDRRGRPAPLTAARDRASRSQLGPRAVASARNGPATRLPGTAGDLPVHTRARAWTTSSRPAGKWRPTPRRRGATGTARTSPTRSATRVTRSARTWATRATTRAAPADDMRKDDPTDAEPVKTS